MRFLKLAVLLAALAAISPSIATARPFDETDWVLYREALAYWGAPAPIACLSVAASVEPLREGLGGLATEPRPGEDGLSCVLRISDALPLCAERGLMHHEVGHLLGYGHSDDPSSFMHSPPPNVFCEEEGVVAADAQIASEEQEIEEYREHQEAIASRILNRTLSRCRLVWARAPTRSAAAKECRRDLGLARAEVREYR